MASSIEKLQTINDNYSKIRNCIDKKKEIIDSKIMSLKKDINELDNKYPNNTEQWKQDQREKIQKKINELQGHLNIYIETQTKKMDNWFDNVKTDIQKIISEKLVSMINALS